MTNDVLIGEVWLVDLGLAAKVRPRLILTKLPNDNELALVTLVPHTTALRKNPWELSIPKLFLKKGAFHFQQIQSVPLSKLLRKLGELNKDEMNLVRRKLSARLSL